MSEGLLRYYIVCLSCNIASPRNRANKGESVRGEAIPLRLHRPIILRGQGPGGLRGASPEG